MGTSIEGAKQRDGRCLVDALARGITRSQRERHSRVGLGKFRFDDGLEKVQVDPQSFLAIGRDSNDRPSLPRNGIAQVTPVDGTQLHIIFGKTAAQETSQYLVGIATTGIYVATRVAALQFRHRDAQSHISGRKRRSGISKCRCRVDTSGTAYEYLGLIFGVEIEQIFAGNEPLFHIKSSGKAGLLIDGKQGFKSRVHQGIIGEGGQGGSHTYTVVGSERRTAGSHPFTIDISVDGVFLKIVLHIGIFLAHHIHVRLQDDTGLAFTARRGRLAHKHVTDGIGAHGQMVFPGKIEQVSPYFFFFFRGSGHLGYLIEITPNQLRFQIFDFHSYDDL